MIAELLLIALAESSVGITRDEVVARAKQYAEHSWVMQDVNVYADCADEDYQSDQELGEQVGVPYAWGGYMSVAEFDERIASGEGAGSHSWHDVLDCVAGVDCSGYVSYVWGASHQSTRTLESISEPIQYEDIQPGDAFNKPGSHVVLYIGEADSGQPMFYEASGSASRVRLHYGASYIDGYVPIRYEGIVDDDAVGASDNVESRDASSARSAVDDNGNEPVEEAGEAGLATDVGELTDAPRWQIVAGVIATVVIATALSLLLGTVLRSRHKRRR